MLPSSGKITFDDIAGEMGGAKPYALNAYYSGGPNVPTNSPSVTPPNIVPAAGPISFTNFYGSAKYKNQGTSGTTQLAYTISSGEGGVGENFYRVVGAWSATYGGTVYVQYYATATAEKTYYMYFQRVRDGVATNIASSTGGGGSGFVTPNPLTYTGPVDVIPGDVLRGYCYLWGNYGSDRITGGYFNVYGTA